MSLPPILSVPARVHRAAQSPAASASAVVDAVVGDAVQRRASDVHLERGDASLLVRVRIDGELLPPYHLPVRLHAGCLARLKILAGLRIDEHAVPQDGTVALPGMPGVSVRIATIPARLGERATIRLFGTFISSSLADLGMPSEAQAAVTDSIASTDGLVLICGPTGSGKTTTAYALLAQVAALPRALITIEDPIEFPVPGATQVPVGGGFGFADALRAVLRQDPDVILVGEVRDSATAALAVHASLTGHLVLATLHAPDAIGAIMRLRSLGADAHELAWGLRTIIGQRLVRSAQGRRGVFEILTITPALREAVAAGAPAHELHAAAFGAYV